MRGDSEHIPEAFTPPPDITPRDPGRIKGQAAFLGVLVHHFALVHNGLDSDKYRSKEVLLDEIEEFAGALGLRITVAGPGEAEQTEVTSDPEPEEAEKRLTTQDYLDLLAGEFEAQMTEKGLKQKDLVEATDLSKISVSRAMRGFASLGVYEKIAPVLEIDLSTEPTWISLKQSIERQEAADLAVISKIAELVEIEKARVFSRISWADIARQSEIPVQQIFMVRKGRASAKAARLVAEAMDIDPSLFDQE